MVRVTLLLLVVSSSSSTISRPVSAIQTGHFGATVDDERSDYTVSSLQPDGRCINIRDRETRHFYHNLVERRVSILTSTSTSHRLVSEVFRLFGGDVLGYSLYLVTNTNINNTLEPDVQFGNISSCRSKFCNDLDDRVSQTDLRVPDGMLTVGVMLPPSHHVDTWGLVDLGQLGPSPRYGWFLPSRVAETSPAVLDHWRSLQAEETVHLLSPSPQHIEFVLTQIRDPSGRYYCDAPYCTNGIYEPPFCAKSRHRGTTDCALLLTDYPVHTSLFNTSRIADQIRNAGLLVKIIFIGPSLFSTVDYLQSHDSPYLVLSQHPSVLTTRYNYTQLKFPHCNDPLYLRELEPGCMYSPHRMAKVVWKPVQNSAPELFSFLENFSLTNTEYSALLTMYNQLERKLGDSFSITEVACRWLKHSTKIVYQGRLRTIKWYEKWTQKLDRKTQIFIGGIFPISGTKYVAPELAPVAQMAVRDINANSSILPKHDLVLDIQDGQCEADVVMKRFIDVLKTKDQARFRSTIGILGPACSDTVEPIAGVSKHFRTVVISYSAEGSISGSVKSKEYPYFFRTIAENKQYKYVYMETLKKLGWKKIGALTEDGQKYSDYISAMQDEFQKNGITFVINRKFPRDAHDMTMYLNDLKERGARIIIGDFYVNSARHVMCQAYKLGMTQKEGYVWFLPGWFKDDWFKTDLLREAKNSSESLGDSDNSSSNGKRHNSFIRMNENQNVGSLPDCSTQEMVAALNGHFSLVHTNYARDNDTMQTNKTVAEWKTEVRTILNKTMNKYMEQNQPKYSKFSYNHNEPNKYSGYVYDAVWLYALSLDTLIRQNMSYIQNLHSERTVTQFVKIIEEIDFTGVSGRINFYGRQSRLSKIRIMHWYPEQVIIEGSNESRTQYTHQIGEYEPNYRNDTLSEGGKMRVWNPRNIRWQTPDGSKPTDDAKDCGLLSAFATSLGIECTLAITVIFIVSFCFLLLLLAISFFAFKRRYERKMKAAEERMRALGLLTPMSALTLDEWEIPRDRVVINRKLGEGAFGTVYGGESFFDEKGWVAVAVKTLKVGSSFEEKVDFLSEAEMMKRFDHKNIVKLLGVCTRNEPVYTVMEYMLYGDLKTYLLARRHLVNERNREELDEVSNRRLTSMAHDVAKGLAYLADLKYVHRDVACRNCLVNSGRTVKLADFGMTRAMFESDYYRFSRKGMLPVRWMSPESLADGLFTPMSDVWSYGVLLYEIVTFGSFPFQGLSNNQVLEHVKAGNTLSVPSGIKPQLGSLLKSCWSRTPTKRPSAGEIVELLANTPRLVSPCIDVPLASVQIERTDSLEMVPGVRSSKSSRRKEEVTVSPLSRCGPGEDHPLLVEREDVREAEAAAGSGLSSGSYVPPGYIILDHRTNAVEYTEYVPGGVTSL